MTTTTEGNSTMKSFARITMNQVALVFAAASFTVSTPCFAATLSKSQGLAISGNIVGAEGIASSAVGPAAVSQLSTAINTLGNGVNTMVDDLSKVLPHAQASAIKQLVAVAQSLASQAPAQPGSAGLQTLANSFNQLGNAIQQLAAALPQNVFGRGGTEEINGIVTNNEGLFTPGVTSAIAAPGNTQGMAQATRGFADGLGVMVNILTT